MPKADAKRAPAMALAVATSPLVNALTDDESPSVIVSTTLPHVMATPGFSSALSSGMESSRRRASAPPAWSTDSASASASSSLCRSPTDSNRPSLASSDIRAFILSVRVESMAPGIGTASAVGNSGGGVERESLVFLMYRGKGKDKMLYSITSKVVKDEISVKHMEEFGNTQELSYEKLQKALENKI